MADLSDLKAFTSKKKAAFAKKEDLSVLGTQLKKADTLMSSSKSVSQKPNFSTRKAFKSTLQQEVPAEEQPRVVAYASTEKTKKYPGEHDWASRELAKQSKAPFAADAMQFRRYRKQIDKPIDGTGGRLGKQN